MNRLYNVELSRKSFLIKGKSFEQWCKENDREDILDRWDFTLNKFSPKDINYSTNEKYWIKCPNKLHKSELKIISSITQGNNVSVKCNACNSLGQWFVNNYGEDAIKLYWSNNNSLDPFDIAFSSNKKVFIICQNCGEIKLIKPNLYINQGIGCKKCSDGIPYGEKFVYSMLEQIDKNFYRQVGKTLLGWCKINNYKYDFYVIYNNKIIIIETHGLQHYEKCGFTCRTLEEEQENDRLKEQLAKANGIEHYIVLDCRYSKLEWIKNSILDSELLELLKFTENDIKWNKCHEFACKSLVKEVCNLYNNGMIEIKSLCNKFKLNETTVKKYLKQGSQINLCNYDPEKAFINNCINRRKKIYCVELNRIFNSISEAENILKINNSSITKCCQGKLKTAGKYRWMYY
jgi:hypothetical protein